MNDYERIAKVIRYLDACREDQPDLATLARQAGVSPYHFHRLFTAWAAITPKDFLQCLTLEHAVAMLRRGNSVLDAALAAGLSGPGRLHDLCVHLEAATPGEVKSGGAGWRISAGFAASPFGRCLIAQSPRGICHLAFVEPGREKPAWSSLRDAWPGATFVRDDRAARRLAMRIFARPGTASPRPALRTCVRGTEFQVRVWRALVKTQPGTFISYGGLAAALDMPRAARAVGSAVAQNPLAYLVPCHRVIRETGVVGNYRWGPVRKRAIMVWESAQQHILE